MLTDDKRLESLENKNLQHLKQLGQVAIENPEVMAALVDGLVAKDHTYRENCFLTLLEVCQQQPETLYPHWEQFVSLLDSPNAFQRAIGVQLLAHLCKVDTQDQFGRLFERYFALLDDQKIMVSRYLVQNLWRIVAAKPGLQDSVLDQLLSIEQTHHPEGRKALLKADAIEVLAQVYPQQRHQTRVLALVESALTSSSPKARQAAKRFLEEQDRPLIK